MRRFSASDLKVGSLWLLQSQSMSPEVTVLWPRGHLSFETTSAEQIQLTVTFKATCFSIHLYFLPGAITAFIQRLLQYSSLIFVFVLLSPSVLLLLLFNSFLTSLFDFFHLQVCRRLQSVCVNVRVLLGYSVAIMKQILTG